MRIIIDGREIETEERKTVLETARDNGISIPSLCDHPRLIPFTGCRMCIVQVKGEKGYLPACSTLIRDGMEVQTQTPQVLKLRKQILELILTEHPNACLICTEKENCDELKSTIRKVGEVTGCVLCTNNGRCELQDIVEESQLKKVSFSSYYREVEIKRNDPFFDRNYNLCILCGRCVRICHEVRGLSTLTFIRRGPDTVVGTALDRSLLDSNCQFCGACVDVCSTGALSEKAIKYEGLPDKTSRTICPLCSLGCELEVDWKEGRMLRSSPAAEGAVNRGQACVKGRFTLKDVIYTPRRIQKPMIRRKKELHQVTWDEALDFITQSLKTYKGKEMALVGSSQMSCEDGFVLQKFAENVLKTKNVCQALSFSPLSTYTNMLAENGMNPDLNFKVSDISKAKVIFLLGINIAASHPIVWLEVLQAVKDGAKLIIASADEYLFSRYASRWIKLEPGTESHFILSLSKIILEHDGAKDQTGWEGFRPFKESLERVSPPETVKITGVDESVLRDTAEGILADGPAVFLFGTELASRPSGKESLTALWNLSLQVKARIIPLSSSSNLRGLFEMNHSRTESEDMAGKIIKTLEDKQVKALYLAGPFRLSEESKPEFLIVQDSYENENVERADVVLPTTTFAETDGIFVNTEGRIQKFERILEPLGDARPDWWVFSQLAQRKGRDGFAYKRTSEILRDIRREYPTFTNMVSTRSNNNEDFIAQPAKAKARFIAVKPLKIIERNPKGYPVLMKIEHTDDHYKSLVLSEEIKGFRLFRDSRWIRITQPDADRLKLKDGDSVEFGSPSGKIRGVVKISDAVSRGIVIASLPPGEAKPPSSLLPVRIKRGK